MASTDKFMPLYIGDYLRDTTRLTTEAHGAYLLLLMDYWINGPAPDDDLVLSSITKLALKDWRKIRPFIAPFFHVESGMWMNKRSEAERAKAVENVDKKRAAGSAGGTAARGKSGRKPNSKKIADAINFEIADELQKNTPSPSPSDSSVEEKDTSSLHSDVCAEPQAAHAPAAKRPAVPDLFQSPVFISIPTNRFATSGEEVSITEAKVTEYEAAYPAVDVRQQLRQMRQWSIDKPNLRKTQRGMLAFVNSWLAREQNKGGNRTYDNGRNDGYQSGHKPNAHDNFNLGAALAGGVVPGRYEGAPQPGDDTGDALEFGQPRCRAA